MIKGYCVEILIIARLEKIIFRLTLKGQEGPIWSAHPGVLVAASNGAMSNGFKIWHTWVVVVTSSIQYGSPFWWKCIVFDCLLLKFLWVAQHESKLWAILCNTNMQVNEMFCYPMLLVFWKFLLNNCFVIGLTRMPSIYHQFVS